MFKTLYYLLSLGLVAGIIFIGFFVAMLFAVACSMMLKPLFGRIETELNQVSTRTKFYKYGHE